MATVSPPASLWVKLENGSVAKVKTAGCDDIDDFAREIKATFGLDKFSAPEISVFLKETDTEPLKPGHSLHLIAKNDGEHPLFVKLPSPSTRDVSCQTDPQQDQQAPLGWRIKGDFNVSNLRVQHSKRKDCLPDCPFRNWCVTAADVDCVPF